MEERLQKILARAGISSRRAAEELIEQGEVTVNGKVAKIGDKATWGKDAIKVKGKLLQANQNEELVYYAFHKPRGVLATLSDTDGRPTLADYTKGIKARVFPVGRLDFNSEGLIILTNDGAFMEKVQKREDIPRFYHVKVKGHPTQVELDNLKKGAKIPVPGHIDRTRMVRPHTVRIATKLDNKSVIEIVVVGAAATDLRTLFEYKGFLVEKTIRYGIGQISIRGVLPGGFKVLKSTQVQALLEHPELALTELAQRIEEDQERESEGRSWVKGAGGLIAPVGGKPKRAPRPTARTSAWGQDDQDKQTDDQSSDPGSEKTFGERRRQKSFDRGSSSIILPTTGRSSRTGSKGERGDERYDRDRPAGRGKPAFGRIRTYNRDTPRSPEGDDRRPARSQWGDRPSRPERPSRSDRPERPARSKWSEGSSRSDWSDRPGRSDRPRRSDSADRPSRSGWGDNLSPKNDSGGDDSPKPRSGRRKILR